MDNVEGRAALRVLVAVAQADGKIEPEESTMLAQAISDWVPGLASAGEVAALLSQTPDLDAELAKLTTPVTKRAVFEAAMAMALADGKAKDEENRVLARIRETLGAGIGESFVERSRREKGYQWGLQKGAIPQAPALDPEDREQRVRRLILRQAAIAFYMGLLPFPVASGILVGFQFDRMIDGIALLWGHPLTTKERLQRFGGYLGTATMGAVLHSLFHVAPVVGSLAAATAAYASTMALGYVVHASFKKGGKATRDDLAKAYVEGKENAKAAFAENKDQLEANAKAHRDAIADLTKKLEANEIDIEEYDQRVGEIIRHE